MADETNGARSGLSEAERSQIKYLVRFLFTVLFFVIAASLTMAFVVNMLLQ
ncbi:MAG: hypothetical protein SF029_01970 [bacterium]|nr:hypothetical protein [bacterium]